VLIFAIQTYIWFPDAFPSPLSPFKEPKRPDTMSVGDSAFGSGTATMAVAKANTVRRVLQSMLRFVEIYMRLEDRE